MCARAANKRNAAGEMGTFEPDCAGIEGALVMTREEDVLAALDKPRAVYALQKLLDPSSKSSDALQDLLIRMRAAGKVKFDIKTGLWSKA